eukprot:CAMPEP_0179265736 /NCGR_PEP_ID=MMETSP0797-20121207/29056_1 /TAXON_ID=47934 /ORGANISM="Dinophysis acuminata, Strain DAEP01" /LENGTH=319 /DNA_ID=CAMNT_0020973951 /DNA_START=523 /DNA_END=1482 /DNA_ORIENTATION=+
MCHGAKSASGPSSKAEENWGSVRAGRSVKADFGLPLALPLPVAFGSPFALPFPVALAVEVSVALALLLPLVDACTRLRPALDLVRDPLASARFAAGILEMSSGVEYVFANSSGLPLKSLPWPTPPVAEWAPPTRRRPLPQYRSDTAAAGGPPRAPTPAAAAATSAAAAAAGTAAPGPGRRWPFARSPGCTTAAAGSQPSSAAAATVPRRRGAAVAPEHRPAAPGQLGGHLLGLQHVARVAELDHYRLLLALALPGGQEAKEHLPAAVDVHLYGLRPPLLAAHQLRLGNMVQLLVFVEGLRGVGVDQAGPVHRQLYAGDG